MPADIVNRWFSGSWIASIDGLELTPTVDSFMPNTPLSVSAGQAEAFYIKALSGSRWILKKFHNRSKPDLSYLQAIKGLVPKVTGTEAATTRGVLRQASLQSLRGAPSSSAEELAGWIDSTVLMQEVPGSSWGKVAGRLREGRIALSRMERIGLAMSLCTLTDELEKEGCAHRDFSSGNLLFDLPNGRVFLIDWDSFFHPSLRMPLNTTPGTAGYIAPFIPRSGQLWDASASWCRAADRFALAILVTEVLVARQGSPSPEDGGLFDQEELCRRNGPGTAAFQQALVAEFPSARDLLARALSSRSFLDCPSPNDWAKTLEGEARRKVPARTTQTHPGHSPIPIWKPLPALPLTTVRARSKHALRLIGWCTALLVAILLIQKIVGLQKSTTAPTIVTGPQVNQAPQNLPRVPVLSELMGTWLGTVQQPNYGSFQAVVEVDGSTSGRIKYSDLRCGGTLVFQNADGNGYVFKERLDYGATKCIDGGTVRIEKKSSTELDFQWWYPNGAWGASGLLARSTPAAKGNSSGSQSVAAPDTEAREVVIGDQPSSTSWRGLEKIDCSNEKSLRSSSGDSVAIRVVNNSVRVVKLFWVDFNGARVLYGVLQPGHSVDQQTFMTHPWVITSEQDTCLGVFAANPQPVQSTQNVQTAETAKQVPVQVGTVATCSFAYARGNYMPKAEFLPGDRLAVYAEANFANTDGRIDLGFGFVIFGPDGTQLGTAEKRIAIRTYDSSWASWSDFAISPSTPSGLYTAKVEIHDNLTGQTATQSVSYRVLPSPQPSVPVQSPSVHYSGPFEGILSWAGEINSSTEIVIEGVRANIGVVQGQPLPGVGCEINVLSQTRAIAIVEPPMPLNNYSRLVVRIDGRGRQGFSLRWRVLDSVR